MLFSQDKNKEKQTKKRSILGFLFNPDIGSDVRPLAESAGMFVRMLALVLATNRLFPKDHPALTDSRAPLTIREVISIAWNGLSFTREGIPQIILFFAVMGCIAFSALFIITLLFSLLVGSAHAADGGSTAGMFTSPAGDGDLAIGWVDYLFQGKPIIVSGENFGATKNCALQAAMSRALGFYSNAILVFAGIILLYHLTSMIVKTAQTGKPLGGANELWAPIRLVFAIGMLVPIGVGASSSSSCDISGYNTGQYVVMQLAKWGSGLASNTWSFFLEAMNDTSKAPSCVDGAPTCIKVSPEVKAVALGMIANYGCAAIYNHYLKQYDEYSDYYISVGTRSSGGHLAEGRHPFGLKDGSYAIFGKKEAANICGGLEVSPTPTGIYSKVYKAQLTVFTSYLNTLDSFARKSFIDAIPGAGTISDDRAKAIKEELDKTLHDFQENLTKEVQAAMAAADDEARQKQGENLKDPIFSSTGWLSAGAWFNTITRLQSTRAGSVFNALPMVIKPVDYSKDMKSHILKDVVQSSSEAFERYKGILELAASQSVNSGYKTDAEGMARAAQGGTRSPSTETSTWDAIKEVISKGNPVNAILSIVDEIGYTFNLWDAQGTLSLKFGKTSNPFAELVAYGQNNIQMGSWALGFAGGAFLAGASFAGTNIAPVAMFIGALLTGLASLFFTIGFTIAFLIPLYPFYRFFFASIKWIMSIFEAVVSMPLFALAHINPGGEGLAGPQGKYGYSMAVHILLRPVLMIFGLMAGYMLFGVALSFLNTMFAVAAKGTGAFVGGTPMLAKLLYSLIYCALVFMCANQCFKTIGLFPQVALTWLGVGGVREEAFGDTNFAAGAVGWVTKGALDKHLPSIVKGPANLVQHYKDDAKKKADKKEEDEWKQNMLAAALAGGRPDSGENPPPDGGGDGPRSPNSPSGSGGGGGRATGTEVASAVANATQFAAGPAGAGGPGAVLSDAAEKVSSAADKAQASVQKISSAAGDTGGAASDVKNASAEMRQHFSQKKPDEEQPAKAYGQKESTSILAPDTSGRVPRSTTPLDANGNPKKT